MKISLPNAEEYLHREELFFDQLELAVYHARKSWDKIKKQKQYQGEDAIKQGNYPWIKFGFSKDIEDFLDENDPDYNDRNISIEIEELT